MWVRGCDCNDCIVCVVIVCVVIVHCLFNYSMNNTNNNNTNKQTNINIYTHQRRSIFDVNQCGATHSADLGGSSKYSYETYED